ncbi:MAG TPA: histidine ammonia-lyase [Acidimicrobiia bacterium]|nr:histidine ammonia-lyase [Acidimicrobiia bacterium]
MSPQAGGTHESAVVLDGSPLSVADVVAVARHGAPVTMAPEAAERMAPARAVVERIVAEGASVYGLTTGFGALAAVKVSPAEARRLQLSLVLSHAAGMGDLVEPEVVRAMMLLRARTLAAGLSGARPVLVERLVSLLMAGLTPVVPELGSLGASGDLAPLAHVGAVLTGAGEVIDADGRRRPGADGLAAAGLEPVVLEAKEGLALLNGTEGMLAHLCLALVDLDRLAATADVACAITVEALLGTDAAYRPELHTIRPHPGQQRSAANLSRLLAGSEIVASHGPSDHAVQDAYSLRCAPQVHGASRDVIAFARSVVERELASVTDNPVVLPDAAGGAGAGEVASTGNFHGQPLAFAADFCAIALADLAAISERRTDRLMDPARSQGLPAFLAVEAGINSGFMLAHYTAAAGVNRLRTHATPASIDSISTSGGQEDHVSMGWNACRKLRTSIDDVGRVLAIEILCAAQALELRREGAGGFGPGIGHPEAGLRPSSETEAVIARLRTEVPALPSDRFLAPDLAAAERLVRSGALLPDWIL